MITIRYRACDGCRDSRKFKTIGGARRFAHSMVGQHPEIGHGYAIAGDGVGRVTVSGATLAELFQSVGADDPDAAYEAAMQAHRAETREAERIMAEEWEAEHAAHDGISDYQRACEDGSLLEWELSNGDW